MYLPKIVLSPELIVVRQTNVKPIAKEHIRASINLASSQKIEVLVVNQTAILRGVVSSDKEKNLAATLALFEPGIWNVDNQLQVEQAVQPNP
ncbi:MAG: BON domain-containing protein [Rubripirellula sp.]